MVGGRGQKEIIYFSRCGGCRGNEAKVRYRYKGWGQQQPSTCRRRPLCSCSAAAERGLHLITRRYDCGRPGLLAFFLGRKEKLPQLFFSLLSIHITTLKLINQPSLSLWCATTIRTKVKATQPALKSSMFRCAQHFHAS